MPGILDTIQALNSVVRTVLAVGVVGAVGTAGWLGYRTHHASSQTIQQQTQQIETFQQEIATLSDDLAVKSMQLVEKSRRIVALVEDVEERDRRIEQLDTAMRLLTIDHRLARLTVLGQGRDPQSGQLLSSLRFVELDEQGSALDAPRDFEISGNVVFVDAWVVKFDDAYVQQADLLRGTSLVLFRRLFGEHQTPEEGFVLDEVGVRPRVYGRQDEASAFEKKIWADFWVIANDPQRARELGIRAAHGEAPSIRVDKGKSYLLILRASDGLSITVDPARSRPGDPAS